MANARTRKLELERAKRTKAAQKRERRQDKATEDEAAAAAEAESPATELHPESDVEVLTSLRLLHERFADGEMAFDDFELAKTDLMQKLDVR